MAELGRSQTDAFIEEFVAYFVSRSLPINGDNDLQRPPLPIRPVRIGQRFDQEDFLTLLNSYPLVRSTGTSRAMGLLGRLNKESERLRSWVDEWLASGRTAEGVECPADRNYEHAKAVSAAVESYSSRGKIRLKGIGRGLQLWLDLQDGKDAPTHPGVWPWTLFIETIAQEKLVLFLLSDLSYKLARCRVPECGQYFVLKQWNRTYKTGTLCEECQRARSLKSAATATSHERDRAERKLHLLAASHFCKQIRRNPAWHTDPKLKDRIARHLCEKIEDSANLRKIYPAGVTGKWVARAKNWTAIERAAKER